jgi:hypothetical protein
MNNGYSVERYKIIWEFSTSYLDDAVNEELSKGGRLVGNVFVCKYNWDGEERTVFHQPMITKQWKEFQEANNG